MSHESCSLLNMLGYADCFAPCLANRLVPLLTLRLGLVVRQILDDAMMLGKNVAVMRNFCLLPANMRAARAAAKASEAPWYIDLWPLSVNPGSVVQNTYEVIFQLGSVVHLVPRWRNSTRLRVCHIVERAEDLSAERERLRAILIDLRVDAEIKVRFPPPITLG